MSPLYGIDVLLCSQVPVLGWSVKVLDWRFWVLFVFL